MLANKIDKGYNLHMQISMAHSQNLKAHEVMNGSKIVFVKEYIRIGKY